MAVGRDAADVAITTSFGTAALRVFTVVTNEVTEAALDAPVLTEPAITEPAMESTANECGVS